MLMTLVVFILDHAAHGVENLVDRAHGVGIIFGGYDGTSAADDDVELDAEFA